MIRFKDGVEFGVIAPGGYKILAALRTIASTFPKDVTITAGTNGQHKKTSRHYLGLAYDVRSHDQTSDEKMSFLAQLNILLGAKFYYFLEDEGTDNEHWHIQLRSTASFTVKELLA